MTWRMETNIKAQPGSQGTLFQGGSDQMTDAKWPKHYTPERLHQVLPAIAPYKAWVRDEPTRQPWDTASERRKLVDTVARSTVPESHLLGVQFSPGMRMLDMAQPGGEYAAGSYTPQKFGVRPRIEVAVTLAGTGTPIHEIGHHASHLQGPVPYDTPEERGYQEGLADNYEQEHYRNRRGRPEQVPTYAGGTTAGGPISGKRPQAFFNSYYDARGNPQEYDPEIRAAADYIAQRARDYANPTLPLPEWGVR